ncbi:MAG: GxxExxY protein [Petrimonas sp.]|nr:GxxExxY protein [Petrimonas sp.]
MTQKQINDWAYHIIGCAIEVHKRLGPGLLESVYQKCFVEELRQSDFKVQQELKVPILYKGKDLDCELRIDILVNDCIIVELKAVEQMIPVYKAQLLSYLKLTDLPKGLLINFNCENITSQIVSLVTKAFARLPEN